MARSGRAMLRGKVMGNQAAELANTLRAFKRLSPQAQDEVISRVRRLLYPTAGNLSLIVSEIAAAGWYKRCSGCGQPKAETEFYRDRQKPDGFRYKCKSCANPAVYG